MNLSLSNLTTRLSQVVSHRPKQILAITLLLIIAGATLLPRLERDPTPYLLSPDHPSRQNLALLRANYTGSRDAVMVLLETEDTVFKPHTLERIRDLTEAFETLHLITRGDLQRLQKLAENLNGEARSELAALIRRGLDPDAWEDLDLIRDLILQSGQMTPQANNLLDRVTRRLTPIVEVTSLANSDNILALDDSLDVNPIYTEIPRDEAALAEIRRRVLDNRLFRDVLISADTRYTGIFLELAIDDDQSEEQQLVYERVQRVLEKQIPGPEKHYIGGLPVVTATMSRTMQNDTRQLFPVVVLLVMMCLAITFRSLYGIAVPLIVVVLALVATLALKVLCDVPLNIISTALPIFIISIGVADGIHIFSEYRDHLFSGVSKTQAVGATLDHLAQPVVMTSLTTAAAFWTLSVTEIVQMQHFGRFVAVGTLIAMVLSLLFVPALLMVLPQPRRKPGGNGQNQSPDRMLTSMLESISRHVLNSPRAYLSVAAVLIAIALYGATLIQVDSDAISYLKPETEIVRATRQINTHAAGSQSLNLLIEVAEQADDGSTPQRKKQGANPAPEPFKDPRNLQALADLARFAESQPLVGKALGLSRLIRRINLVLHENQTAYDRIPRESEMVVDSAESTSQIVMVSGREMIAQYLLLYENSGGDTLSDVIDNEYRRAHLTLILRTNSARDIRDLMAVIQTYARQHLPQNLTLTFSGAAYGSVAATFEIVSGQVVSLLLSFLIIFTLLCTTFRSLGTGLLAMLPLTTTVTINFGIMGFFNVPLDIGTAVVSSIVIGIGVDYSIHYLNRLRRGLTSGLSLETAVMETVRHSGKAIMANAFTVGLGFTALLSSDFSPLQTMGWMITATMLVSGFATILLFPAFFGWRRTHRLQPRPGKSLQLLPLKKPLSTH